MSLVHNRPPACNAPLARKGENHAFFDGQALPYESWVNQPPNQNLLNNFDVSFLEDTTKVGSYPQGAGPYGALDMVGNVWEWTADWFDAYSGGDIAASENYGHMYRVLRGGSFVDAADATTRYGKIPNCGCMILGSVACFRRCPIVIKWKPLKRHYLVPHERVSKGR